MLAGCGTSGYDTGELAKLIRARLDQHPGFDVSSVQCPKQAKLGKGVVVRCTATLSDGHIVRMRATQLDDKGTVHLVAAEMLADNVERAIVATLARRGVQAQAMCPLHVPVVIGKTFGCTVTDDAGRRSGAAVTIVDGDGGFRLGFT